MDGYDTHYGSSQQQRQWHEPSSQSQQQYSTPSFYQQQQQQQQQQPSQQQPDQMHLDPSTGTTTTNSSTSLSLNLSSLSVASPPNLSPTGTPISPSANSLPSSFSATHHHTFQFAVPENPHPSSSSSSTQQQQSAADDLYDTRRISSVTPTTSRSSSTSSSNPTSSLALQSQHVPIARKRSFTSNASTLVEESYDDAQMELAYDDLSNGSTPYGGGGAGAGAGGGNGSPIEGSTDGGEDTLGGLGLPGTNGSGLGGMGLGSGMSVLGKPMATNNFVTKLYHMINDLKSTHFIAWTELGTSFVVSNVGEFSRRILGSHFKHNNFSSFVRQLNMYGFHKINRRTSTDAQTWEFSHHKFLRGRPDLLEEIKRKALEPDPAVKHRVELPGEVAAQLGAMREENRRVWEQLSAERRRVENLIGIVARLWEVVGKGFPGSVPPFPTDVLETDNNPNIYVTSHNTSRYPPPLSMSIGNPSLHSMHSMSSPNSSPTGGDFPLGAGPNGIHHHAQQQQQQQQQQQHHHHHHPAHHHHPSLSRQHSFQHVSFSRSEGTASTPLPSSPSQGALDLFDGEPSEMGGSRAGTKRQRTEQGIGNISSALGLGIGSGVGVGVGVLDGAGGSAPVGSLGGATKRLSRARSDSAPLGHGMNAWGGGVRPRSGSGMVGSGGRGLGMMGIPNIGSLTRAGGNSGLPLLTIPSLPGPNGTR